MLVESKIGKQYLHLWGNKITDEAAEIIRDIIEDHNNTLFGVTLFDNQIKDADLLKVPLLDDSKSLLLGYQ